MIARIRVDKALPSLANARLHWALKAKVIKAQRTEVMSRWLCLPLADRRRPVARVVFVRTSPRQLDDDNLASAFKAVRDEVASLLGVSDAPGGPVQWRYEQRRGKPGFEVEFWAEVMP
ncbi:MAG: hypothetical protein NTV51_00320 [Verrucomicrobia bacterium]|nr:hypothetical protein [Verrucomicrobiota bacterium]